MNPRTGSEPASARVSRANARASPRTEVPPPAGARPDLPLVEVDVPAGNENHWLRELTNRWPVHARLRLCRPMGERWSHLLQVVELTGVPGDLNGAEQFLRQRREFEVRTVLSPSPSQRYVRIVGPLPPACERIFKAGAICASCRFVPSHHPRGKDRWSLVLPRLPETLKVITTLESENGGAAAPILHMRRFVPPQDLTPRQSAALEAAYRLGFYGFPRRTNLRELARILGVSRSTVAELLRRAEQKMLAHELASL